MTLRLKGSTSGHTEIKAPASAGSNTITLPTSNGSAEQFLKNSGTAGELEFSSMVETSTGVGIGTAAPSVELSIAGSDPQLCLWEGSDGASSSKVQLGTGTSQGFVNIHKGDGTRTVQINSDGVSYFNGGDVLIGTSTSNANDRLTVVDPGDSFISVRSDAAADATSQTLDFGVGTGNRSSTNLTGVIQATIHSQSGGTLKSDLKFFTNAGNSIAEKMRIDSSGNVGVGASSIDTKLHVEGSFTQNDGVGYLKIENTNASTGSSSNTSLTVRSHNATGQFMNWEDRGMRIGQRVIHNGSTGDIYFTSGNDNVRLTIDDSTGNFTGSSSADISDGRLKENIQHISASDAVTIIKGLQGRTFTWKEEAKMGVDTKYGFIAQEVETVIPNLVHQNMGINRVSKNSDKQGYGQGKIVDDYSDAYKDDAQSEWSKSVEKTGMIPILVEALKDALAKIEALETKVAALEAG